jgi:hypothetical protein
MVAFQETENMQKIKPSVDGWLHLALILTYEICMIRLELTYKIKIKFVFVACYLLVISACDKGVRSDSPAYYQSTEHLYEIEFIARPSEPPGVGHAFVNFISDDFVPNQCMIAQPGYGFYPGSSDIINLLYGSGVVKSELDKKPIKPAYKFKVIITNDQFEKARSVYLKWNVRTWSDSNKYSIVTNNCIDFVNEVAKSIGLTTPGTRLKKPIKYIEELYNLNASYDNVKLCTDNDYTDNSFRTIDPMSYFRLPLGIE